MFLRRCKRRKNGKQHTYWALVESYRTARGSRQRVVAYLGELKNNEESGWVQLGRRLDGRPRPQRSLFDPPHYDDPTDDEPVVGTPKAMLRQFEQYLTDRDWREVQEGVEVKLVPGPGGDELFVLARSVDRRQKERAMHQRFIDRMEAALRKLQESAALCRLKDPELAHRRLGRIQQCYWRASGAFDVKISITGLTGSRRIFLCAFWLMFCGRVWLRGCEEIKFRHMCLWEPCCGVEWP